MIRRTASEVLRSLEARVARLEGRTASTSRMNRTSSDADVHRWVQDQFSPSIYTWNSREGQYEFDLTPKEFISLINARLGTRFPTGGGSSSKLVQEMTKLLPSAYWVINPDYNGTPIIAEYDYVD